MKKTPLSLFLFLILKPPTLKEKNKLRFFVSVVIILLKVSFIENAVPELIDGATLAELI